LANTFWISQQSSLWFIGFQSSQLDISFLF
jgi:hypothetical protein